VKKALAACCVVGAVLAWFGAARAERKSPLEGAGRARDAAVKWILANREPSGFLVSSYVPGLDRVHGSDADYTLQPLCLWTLCKNADTPGARAAAKKLCKKLLRDLKPVAGVKGAVAPTYKEKVDTLDAVVLLLALLEARHAGLGEFQGEIDGLRKFLLEAFLPTGSFAVTWPYEETSRETVRFNRTQGLGLYCFARLWASDRSMKRVAEALERAREFWSRTYFHAPARHAGPWLAAAFATAALEGAGKKYDRIVFEIADYMVRGQIDSDRAEFALYRGGFPLRNAAGSILAPPTIETARMALGLSFARRLARKRGDKSRANRYLRGLLLAHGFIRSLQFTDADTNHFRDDVRARLVGSFRVGPEDCRIMSWSVCMTVLALDEFRELDEQLRGSK